MSEGNTGSDELSPRQVAIRVATFIVGTILIAASFVYADIRQDEYEEKMLPYDAAIDLVEQVNGNMYLRAVGIDGKEYEYVVLSKISLEWYTAHPGTFEENITSDHHYRINIDDLNISDTKHNPSRNLSSSYVFGETPPRGTDTVTLTVQYTLHLRTLQRPLIFFEDFRHTGQMTVEVWA